MFLAEARLVVSSRRFTYGVGGGVLLLRGDDAAGALGGVERGFALYYGFAGSGGAAAGAATDLGDFVPAESRHRECGLGVCVRKLRLFAVPEADR